MSIIKNCPHYNNNYQVYAECCNKYYDCHKCHNIEMKGLHSIKIKDINKIRCIKCSEQNDIDYNCKKCKIRFKKKLCKICKLWCNHESHKSEKYYETLDCPICLEDIFNLKNNAVSLICSHRMHATCLDQLIKNTDKTKKIPACTLCKKSCVVFKHFENYFDVKLKEYPMPDYYKNWKSNIICNDCQEKSTTQYHNTYHKCYNCKSYNTSILDIIK